MATSALSALLLACAAVGLLVWGLRRVGAARIEASPKASPAALPGRSSYCLEVSYDFDGGRASTELYVYRSLEFLRRCIAQRLLPRASR